MSDYIGENEKRGAQRREAPYGDLGAGPPDCVCVWYTHPPRLCVRAAHDNPTHPEGGWGGSGDGLVVEGKVEIWYNNLSNYYYAKIPDFISETLSCVHCAISITFFY